MKKKLATTIFLLFSVFCCALEISFSNTNLWKNQTGNAVLFDLHFAEKYVGKKESVNTKFSISNVDSTLDILSGNIFLVNMDFGYENAKVKSCSKLIFPQVSNFFLDVEGKHFIFDETINAFGYFQQFGVKFGKVEISPYLIYGKIPETEGKFYWFNGKVGVPKIFGTGIEVKSHKNQFVGRYGNAKISALNNDDDVLGEVFVDAWIFYYKRLFEFGDFCISPEFGYGNLLGNIDLSLNKNNQQYLVFPYEFYNCIGDFVLHYLNFGLDAEYSKNHFAFSVNSKYFLPINQFGLANLEWKYKKNILFDGSSGKEVYDLDFLNEKSVLLLDVNGSYNFGIKKSLWKIEVSKPFIIPLGFEDEHEPSNETIKSWLTSGLKIGIKIELL